MNNFPGNRIYQNKFKEQLESEIDVIIIYLGNQ